MVRGEEQHFLVVHRDSLFHEKLHSVLLHTDDHRLGFHDPPPEVHQSVELGRCPPSQECIPMTDIDPVREESKGFIVLDPGWEGFPFDRSRQQAMHDDVSVAADR